MLLIYCLSVVTVLPHHPVSQNFLIIAVSAGTESGFISIIHSSIEVLLLVFQHVSG